MISINTNVYSSPYGHIAYLPNDVYIHGFFAAGQVPESDVIFGTLQAHVKSAKTIVDIGAHVGIHTVLYKHMNPACTIHAFELQNVMFQLLQQNIMQNHLQHVHAYNCAVGNKVTTVYVQPFITDGPRDHETFSYDHGHNFGGVQVSNQGTEQHIMMPLDALQLSGLDFMKIDVEGCELPVLLGAYQTICKHRPVIFYENNFKTMTPAMAQICGIPADDGTGAAQLLSLLGYSLNRVGQNILASPA